jgi:hypothetical protein
VLAVALTAALTGCGGGSGSGSGVSVPKIGAAATFRLNGFQPAAPVQPGVPTHVSFTVLQPDGKPLTRYRRGSGPHTGIHLIIVRGDLAYIIHHHPPVAADGSLSDTVTFPAPGPYRVLVDLYPNIAGGQPNFQLFASVNVTGAYHPRPLPPFRTDHTVDGYHVHVQGMPRLHAIQAALMNVNVTDPRGRPVTFVPWFGALAHAIFFHAGSLDYFHTHVCGPAAPNCATLVGGSRISGTSTSPGKLTVGVLLPVPGQWELFLQMLLGGRVVTVPYTLNVAS